MSFARARARMVERQLASRGIADARVLAAMGSVPRELFVPEELRHRAYTDGALPIGEGQSISQPYIVARMVELAAVEPGDRVLDVGTGSGYAAAVLAALGARVVSIERLRPLAEHARRALDEAGYTGVETRLGDGSLGAPDRAPFDAILVAAAAPVTPATLIAQLGPGGRLVIPVGTRGAQQLVVWRRERDGVVEQRSIACRFVPLVGDQGFDP